MVSALGKTGRFAHVVKRGPCSPMAEAEDLKSFQCGFDPHRGHGELITKGEAQVMQSSNPVLNRSFKNPGYAAVDPNKLEEIYNAPSE